MMKEQDRHVEQFRDNIKKFEETSLKTLRFDKFQQYFNKRENPFIT